MTQSGHDTMARQPLLQQGPLAQAWKAPAEAKAAKISLLLGRNCATRETCP